MVVRCWGRGSAPTSDHVARAEPSHATGPPSSPSSGRDPPGDRVGDHVDACASRARSHAAGSVKSRKVVCATLRLRRYPSNPPPATAKI